MDDLAGFYSLFVPGVGCGLLLGAIVYLIGALVHFVYVKLLNQ